MEETTLHRPSLPTNKLILYVVKASPTSGNNVLKPLMLLECLDLDHHIHVISTKTDLWFAQINPLKMVPAIEDIAAGDGSRATVFESSACLKYVADKYDVEGKFSGKTDWERARVASWLAVHDAGLAGHAKWWLTLKRTEDGELADAINIMEAAIKHQYDILEKQLSEHGQKFIALPDRPTIADFATLAFANEQVASVAQIPFEQYVHLSNWSERMLRIEGVARAYERVQSFGTVSKCCS